jgi:hypothetical protein
MRSFILALLPLLAAPSLLPGIHSVSNATKNSSGALAGPAESQTHGQGRDRWDTFDDDDGGGGGWGCFALLGKAPSVLDEAMLQLSLYIQSAASSTSAVNPLSLLLPTNAQTAWWGQVRDMVARIQGGWLASFVSEGAAGTAQPLTIPKRSSLHSQTIVSQLLDDRLMTPRRSSHIIPRRSFQYF